jgi:TonB family protein
LPRGRRPRTTGAGRSGGEVGPVETGPVGTGATADLGTSSVEGAKLRIGQLSAGGATGGAAGADGSTTSSGAAPGVYRTNASLLAVIQKYAAGIQWCYENELKKDPTLRGKMVVAITVSAAGRVTGAAVIENTVDSNRLSSCALSQVRDWRFPPVPEGTTAFQAPFVFTPPK